MSSTMARTRTSSAPFIALLILLLCCGTGLTFGSVQHPKGDAIYKDPNADIEDRVQDLLKRMTLAEKIGQMTQIERVNASQKVMKKYFIGMFTFTYYPG